MSTNRIQKMVQAARLAETPLVVQRAGLVVAIEQRKSILRLTMEHTGAMVTDVAILPGREHLAVGVEVGSLIRVRGTLAPSEDVLGAPGIVAERLDVLPSAADRPVAS